MDGLVSIRIQNTGSPSLHFTDENTWNEETAANFSSSNAQRTTIRGLLASVPHNQARLQYDVSNPLFSAGPRCDQPECSKDSCSHGTCEGASCKCEKGWSGEKNLIRPNIYLIGNSRMGYILRSVLNSTSFNSFKTFQGDCSVKMLKTRNIFINVFIQPDEYCRSLFRCILIAMVKHNWPVSVRWMKWKSSFHTTGRYASRSL